MIETFIVLARWAICAAAVIDSLRSLIRHTESTGCSGVIFHVNATDFVYPHSVNQLHFSIFITSGHSTLVSPL